MKARRPVTRRSKESDSTPNLNHNGHSGPSNDVKNEDVNKSKKKTVVQPSVPGALQCIQHEWAKFEAEKSKWAMDKAELEAKVAFFKGQRKGQERLVHDLVCRIKMLEYSLKEERAKYHKLKYGTELQQGDMKPPEFEDVPHEETSDSEDFIPAKDWRKGRQLIRQYLSEIGYTEAVVNINSYRVNSLLRLYNNPQNKSSQTTQAVTETNIRANDSSNTREGQINGQKVSQPLSITDAILLETQAEIMAKFDFLPHDEDADDERDENDDKDKSSRTYTSEHTGYNQIDNELKVSTMTEGDSETHSMTDALWVESWPLDHSEEALGDLAYLKVNAVAEHSDYMIWKIKYMLRGHYDSVRALAFHPVEPLLATASEDHTINLWNLDESSTPKPCKDLETSYTFRGHSGPVMCVAISPSGKSVFSGGLDGSLLCWGLPESKKLNDGATSDLTVSLEGHTDIVWGLSYQLYGGRTTLLSCSSDGSVKLWAPEERITNLSSFCSQDGECPTSVDFVRVEINHMVTSYDTGECIVYDLEYGKPLVWLETPKDHEASCRINRVISHPIMPVTVTACEDGCIRFFDNMTGMLVQTIVGHRDSVTSIAIDRFGMYMLSGSHDCTMCVWDVRAKNRIQQIYTHGKKFEESVFDVAFHQTQPLIASAGADGFVQVFKPT